MPLSQVHCGTDTLVVWDVYSACAGGLVCLSRSRCVSRPYAILSLNEVHGKRVTLYSFLILHFIARGLLYTCVSFFVNPGFEKLLKTSKINRGPGSRVPVPKVDLSRFLTMLKLK